MGVTNTQLDKLNSLVSNLKRYPNIQTNTYDSLQRYLSRYWQRTYGVNFVNTINSTLPTIKVNFNPSSVILGTGTSSTPSASAGAGLFPTSGLGASLSTQSAYTSYTSSLTRLLVLAVHGTKTETGDNKGATAKNVIFLANQVYNFPPNTGADAGIANGDLKLYTPKNNGVPVSVKGYKGNGVIEINEDLILDVMTINSGGTDYEKNSNSFPYLEYTKIMKI